MDLPSGNQPGGWEIWEIPKVNGYLSGKMWRNYIYIGDFPVDIVPKPVC